MIPETIRLRTSPKPSGPAAEAGLVLDAVDGLFDVLGRDHQLNSIQALSTGMTPAGALVARRIHNGKYLTMSLHSSGDRQ
jgi:hypothetical protein